MDIVRRDYMLVKLCNKKLRVSPTYSWASRDWEDCKTLQLQPEVFHLVAAVREDEEQPDLLVCSPRPATIPQNKITDSRDYLINFFTSLSSSLIISWPNSNINLVREALTFVLMYGLHSVHRCFLNLPRYFKVQ